MKKKASMEDMLLFEKLTEAALGEEDAGSFIGLLLEREKVSGLFAGPTAALEGALAESYFKKELMVIERLEKERAKLLAGIDLYSRRRRAARSYASKFPLPPTLPFFDQINKKT